MAIGSKSASAKSCLFPKLYQSREITLISLMFIDAYPFKVSSSELIVLRMRFKTSTMSL